MIPRLYHGATTILTPESMGVGPLRASGVTVHYTGDRGIKKIQRSLINQSLGYHLVIARDGEVIQFTYLDLRVYHAGKASWNGQSPNRSHIAIAVESYGKLQREPPGSADFCAWNGDVVKIENIAVRAGNISMNRTQLPWDAATTDQENSLMSALRWFVSLGIKPREICGHDECAIPIGRKVDPGGVLSMTMAEVRKSLV